MLRATLPFPSIPLKCVERQQRQTGGFDVSNVSFCNNNELLSQLFTVTIKKSADDLDFVRGHFVFQAHKHDAAMRIFFAENFITEILVRCNENPIFTKCLTNDIDIIHPASFVINREDIVPA